MPRPRMLTRCRVAAGAIAVSAAIGSAASELSGQDRRPQSDTQPRTFGIPAASRVRVNLEIPDQVRLGVPVEVRATAMAIISSRAVRLRITTPELTSGLGVAHGPKPLLPVGIPIPPVVERTADMAAGTSQTVVASLIFPAPGMYTVSAAAVADEGIIFEGRLVDNGASHTLYVFIDENGATITPRYSADLFPPWAFPEPGAYRHRDAARRPLSMAPAEYRHGGVRFFLAGAELPRAKDVRLVIRFRYSGETHTLTSDDFYRASGDRPRSPFFAATEESLLDVEVTLLNTAGDTAATGAIQARVHPRYWTDVTVLREPVSPGYGGDQRCFGCAGWEVFPVRSSYAAGPADALLVVWEIRPR